MLVLCEVYAADGKPHPTNTRAALRQDGEEVRQARMLFGIEQEYTFFKDGRPYGFPIGGFPAPQGPYYCGVGSDEIFGREIVEEHLDTCIDAGLSLSGTNAEVMPGQWEFQIGPLGPLEVSDQLWVARWLLHRIAEDYDVVATLDAKPMKGDWNGAGAHTNFSTKAMREEAATSPSRTPARRSARSGSCTSRTTATTSRTASPGTTRRRRGTSSATACPTAAPRSASRGRSHKDGKGYAEDRRPNANMDPYMVTRLIVETVCGGDLSSERAASADRLLPATAVDRRRVPAFRRRGSRHRPETGG